MKSYAIIGLGRFGSHIAEKLYEMGGEVLAIDINDLLIDSISSKVTKAVVADAKNKDVLRSLGIQNCDCAIVAMASDLASSVLVTMNLKSLGVKHIICKAHDDTHREILEKLGANNVIIPERAVAEKLAKSLTSPDVLEYINLSEHHGIVELKAPIKWCEKTIRELNVRAKYNVNIIAVKQKSGIKVSPGADHVIEQNDILVLLGRYDALDKIEKQIR